MKLDVLAYCPMGPARGEDSVDFNGKRGLTTSYSAFRKPVLNAYDLLHRLGEQRVRITSDPSTREIAAVATRTAAQAVQVMLCRFDAREGLEPVEVELRVGNLPFGQKSVLVDHYRIDEVHSNAFRRWVEVGRPPRPTAEQQEVIRSGEGLELIEQKTAYTGENGALSMKTTMPAMSVSLFVLKSLVDVS